MVLSLEMTSTIQDRARRAVAIAFWLIMWELASLLIGEELFLPSPVAVVMRLFSMIGLPGFWSSILFTLSRIISGFVLSVAAALLLAVLSNASRTASFLI